ncbi:MAG TPA: SRPBCC domain-containing protein [Acidimicrobiia bacterium]|nr:SRPBCC domain-containing protein [Acidimicrobiia bacterium]
MIPAPIEVVWAEIADVTSVVSCIPGAELGAAQPDGSFEGTLGVAFGPMHVKFEGNVRVELSHDDHSGVITASARDRRGAARLRGHATLGLSTAPDRHTSLTLIAEIQVAGKMAPQIEGGANFVTGRLSTEFLERITERVAGVRTDGYAKWWQRVAGAFGRLWRSVLSAGRP